MTGRRGKNALIFVSLVVAALVLTSWTQTWFTVDIGAGFATRLVTVDGSKAAPALTALALSELVLLLALAIAGPVFRIVLGVIQGLVGVAIIASAASSLADPLTVSEGAITKATAISGHASIVRLVGGRVTASAWPVVSLVAGVLLILLAVAIIISSRSWPNSTSRKYTRVAPAPTERTAVDDWDSLSDGDDPTGDSR
ncbi:hypothetical protein BH11ACT2_BH11ACT2_21900 [soil metagenome]